MGRPLEHHDFQAPIISGQLPLHHQEMSQVLIFVRWSQVLSQRKISMTPIGIWTRNRQASSTVRQPTAPLHGPLYMYSGWKTAPVKALWFVNVPPTLIADSVIFASRCICIILNVYLCVLFFFIYYTDSLYKMYKDKVQNCSCNQFHYISTYKQVETNSITMNRGGNNGSEKW